MTEQARDLRIRAWCYVFDCYEKKKLRAKAAGGDGGEDNARKESKHVSRTRIIPR